MAKRKTWHRCFPRSGWSKCRGCGRITVLYYVNELYLTDREAGRNALSDILCRRCIDARYPPTTQEASHA